MTTFAGARVGEKERLLLIAGPCVIESRDVLFTIAEELLSLQERFPLSVIFKASYDKANRTSLSSYRGPGIDEGLALLEDVRKETSLPILTDVHTPEEARIAGSVVDAVQVPAFLCRQTDLLRAACETGKGVNVKKAQFLAGEDMRHVVGKCSDAKNEGRLLLTERGTCFGYHNLVVDMRNLACMRQLAPVVFDATHAVQRPGAGKGVSAGDREHIPLLARAAAAAGIDGLFMEVHPKPEEGLSDSATMLPLTALAPLVQDVLAIRNTLGG